MDKEELRLSTFTPQIFPFYSQGCLILSDPVEQATMACSMSNPLISERCMGSLDLEINSKQTFQVHWLYLDIQLQNVSPGNGIIMLNSSNP